MKVKNWMKVNPVTIERTALLQEAAALMEEHSIRHLPVVENGQLVGFITQTDLRQYFFPSMVERIPVHDVMVANPITIDINSSIEKAARLIHDFKIGGLPVMDKKKLVGMITSSDIVSGFIEVMGLLRSSIRLDLIASADGGVDDALRIIKQHEIEILSVATGTQSAQSKVYYFRLGRGEIDSVVADLESSGHKVLSVME